MSIPMHSCILLISGYIRELTAYNRQIPNIPSDIENLIIIHSKKTASDYFSVLLSNKKLQSGQWISLYEYRWDLSLNSPKNTTNIEIVNKKNEQLGCVYQSTDNIKLYNGFKMKDDCFCYHKITEHDKIDNFDNVKRIIITIILNMKKNRIYFIINNKQYQIAPAHSWENGVKLLVRSNVENNNCKLF